MPRSTESFTPSELDLALVNALQMQPRAGWARLATALEVTPATLARRWQRLRDEGVAWIALTAGHRYEAVASSAFVLVRCATRQQKALAATLAAEPPIATAAATMGRYQFLLDVFLPDQPALRDYVGGRLLELPGIGDVTAMPITQVFRAGTHWRVGALDAAQQRHLDAAGRDGGSPFAADATDRALIAQLTQDGRMSWNDLGVRCGISAPTARRRVMNLLDAGVIELRCEVADTDSGSSVHVTFLMEVAGDATTAAGHYLAGLEKCRIAAAVAGPENLLATMWFASAQEVGRFEADLARNIPGVRVADRIVHLRSVKRVGHVLDHDQRSRQVVPLAVW